MVEPPYLKLVVRDGLPASTTLYYIDKDGNETPLDVCVRRFTVKVDSDDWVCADIEFEGVKVDVTGAVIDVAKTRDIVDDEYRRTVWLLNSLNRDEVSDAVALAERRLAQAQESEALARAEYKRRTIEAQEAVAIAKRARGE